MQNIKVAYTEDRYVNNDVDFQIHLAPNYMKPSR